jgi:segregation and condensation protein B
MSHSADSQPTSNDSPNDSSDDVELSLEQLGAVYAQSIQAASQRAPSIASTTPSADAVKGPPTAADHDPAANREAAARNSKRDQRSDLEGSEVARGTEASWSLVGSVEAIDTNELSFDRATIEEAVVSPLTIIEGALFIGHPENQPLSTAHLSSLMRNVSPTEVEQLIAQLNEDYVAHDHAFRIHQGEGGYRLVLDEALADVRDAFYGRVRESRLSQAAVDVLALVAYQQGVTAEQIKQQSGKDRQAILQQLVRRGLLRSERSGGSGSGRQATAFFTTDRFLEMFQLEKVDDLPQVEDLDRLI